VLSEVIEQYPALSAAASAFSGRWAACAAMCRRDPVFLESARQPVKFVPEGAARASTCAPRCTARARRGSVKDNGVGIDPAITRASRHVRTRRRQEKSGHRHRLAIVKKAVERMGGTVGVISAAGAARNSGSNRVRRSPGPSLAGGQTTGAIPLRSDQPRRSADRDDDMSGAPTVLVVEDDEDDFFLTERALRRYTSGRILHVESGRAAIDYLAGTGRLPIAQHPCPKSCFST